VAQLNESSMRVFHLIKSLGRGGAEMLLVDGPRTSDPARFSYSFGYFLPHKNAVVPELERQFGAVTCFPAKSAGAMLAQTVSIARHLKAWKADLVHCHLPLAGVVGRLAGALAGVPVIYTEHNAIERYHRGTRLAAKATWRLQKSVVAVSADVASSVRRHLGEHVPVNVVRNGVSLERFKPDAALGLTTRRALGIEPGVPVVGLIAVFRKQKRLDLWLQVAARFAERQPDARFLLIGDGPLKAEVADVARSLQLNSRLLQPGLQSDVRPYLACMDAFMMSSDFEGIPIALLEAMASGVVPIVTSAGGMGEVVVDGSSGYVVPKGSVPALDAALTSLLGMPEAQRASMALAARARVGAEFSTRRMMSEIEAIYEETVRR
jgi:L-malate glycosyltransferase